MQKDILQRQLDLVRQIISTPIVQNEDKSMTANTEIMLWLDSTGLHVDEPGTPDEEEIMLEVEMEFDYQPEEPQTRNYPGCPASVEITGLKGSIVGIWDGVGQVIMPIEPVEIVDLDEIIDIHVNTKSDKLMRQLEEACEKDVSDQEAERDIERAEYYAENGM